MRRVAAKIDEDGDLLIIEKTIYESKFLFDCRVEKSARDKTKKIVFQCCLIFEFPSAEMLFKFLPNFTSLEVSYSKLSHVTSNDLQGFESLIELHLYDNEIEELPGDLFRHTPNLERISFANNKIKVIGEKILDPLINLKSFNLRGNSDIDAFYYHEETFYSDAVTLDEFKEAIDRCKSVRDVWKIVDGQRKEIEEIKRVCEKLEAKIEKLEEKLDEVKLTEASKLNFTVKIAEKDFKVQKEILIANSPLLAQIIHENEGAETLELKDISEESFKEILNYMTDKSPPKPTANLMELYAASGRLQMKDLMEMCAKMLMDKVTPENILEIFSLCKKYPNIELQKKAHAEYGKSLEK